jgi:cell pole-organizing protein PopZ
MPAYDKWGHVVTGQQQAAAPAPTVPSLNVGPGLAPAATQGAINPSASGYDMWGRQAPAPAQATPQLPGLADILAMIQAAQARQAANAPAPTGLLSDGASEGGGGGPEGTM